MTFSALILAGTRPGGDPLAGAEGKAHKALIDMDGVPVLQRVIDAVRAAGAARIAVSCDNPQVIALAQTCGAEVLPTGSGPSESAEMGLDALGTPLVLTTADHALLEADWVRQLVLDTPGEADLSVMLAKREDIEAAMPGTRRTYLTFADGAWSGCNLFYLQTDRARLAIESWKAVEADRKRPWRIARRLGLGTLVSYALGRLTLERGIAQLGKQMGVTASLVTACDGLAAVDIDKPQDIADVRAVLASRRA